MIHEYRTIAPSCCSNVSRQSGQIIRHQYGSCRSRIYRITHECIRMRLRVCVCVFMCERARNVWSSTHLDRQIGWRDSVCINIFSLAHNARRKHSQSYAIWTHYIDDDDYVADNVDQTGCRPISIFRNCTARVCLNRAQKSGHCFDLCPNMRFEMKQWFLVSRLKPMQWPDVHLSANHWTCWCTFCPRVCLVYTFCAKHPIA